MSVVGIDDGEACLSARTIKRRLATIAGMYEYLINRGDSGGSRNPVPRGPAMRRPAVGDHDLLACQSVWRNGSHTKQSRL